MTTDVIRHHLVMGVSYADAELCPNSCSEHEIPGKLRQIGGGWALILRPTERDLEKGAVYANITHHCSPIWGMSVCALGKFPNLQRKLVHKLGLALRMNQIWTENLFYLNTYGQSWRITY